MAPFVHVCGRPELYDRIKQGIKACSPVWFVRAVQTVLHPYVLVRERRRKQAKIQRALPAEWRSTFATMLSTARQRWNQGERSATGEPFELPIRDSQYRVWLRPGTCDVLLYYDIFAEEHYGRAPVENVKTIIDCGANIGLASAYFLWRYPESRVIALEPDPVNHEICRRNLAQFGSRATLLKAGLWGTPVRLALQGAEVGTWASSVTVAEPGSDAGIEGFDMHSLLEQRGIDRLDLLKIDIEGAELEVFTADDLSWIDRVRCFQIEPENEACRAAFMRAMGQRPFRYMQHREILIAHREVP